MKGGGSFPQKCPVPDCENIFSHDAKIRTHLTNIHAIDANYFVEIHFANISEFGRWKTKLQDEIGVWYKKVSNYLKKDGLKVTSLRCQSGEARQGVLKEKMEMYCPSAIILHSRASEETISGRYYPTHYGHYSRITSFEILREANVRTTDLSNVTQSTSAFLETALPLAVAQPTPPPLLPSRTTGSDSIVTGSSSLLPLLPPRQPSPLLAPPLNALQATNPTSENRQHNERLDSPCEEVLNLSLRRGDHISSVVSEAQSTVQPDSEQVSDEGSSAETNIKLSTISSESELKVAILKSEVSVADAMEWIRRSFLIGDELIDYKDCAKARKQIHHSQLIWIERQKSGSPDDGSVSALLTKLSQLESENPIISEETVDDDDLENEEHYLIVIMNAIQVKILQDCGDCGIVAVDIHLEGKGEGALNVMSLSVIDAVGEPFPCAISISDIASLSVARRFFSIVKSKTGVINSRVFICGNEEYHEQWKVVMAESQNLFLASWLVDWSWRQSINRLRFSPVEQLALYTALRSLMDVQSTHVFEGKVATVVSEVLHKYNFESSSFLLNKTKLWASCYRHIDVQDCDLRLEFQHQEFLALKSIAKNNGGQTLLILLLTVLDIIRKKCFERLTKLNTFVAPRAAAISFLHDESLQCDVLEIQSLPNDTKWLIKTRDSSCCVWTSDFPPCLYCRLSCGVCDICIHKFMCTCLDNLVSFNMCVHLHIIAAHIFKSEECSRNAYNGDEQCQTEIPKADSLRTEIVELNSVMMEGLRSVTDIETLMVIKDSINALRKMVDTATNS
ncbi:hypothetical protein CHUAL_014141 [Chamberlinius hualienensis]